MQRLPRGYSLRCNIGGGLDERINARFSVHLVEADYLLTLLNNGGSNRQNNLRISAGVVFHFQARIGVNLYREGHDKPLTTESKN